MHRARWMVSVLTVVLVVAGNATTQNRKNKESVRNADRDRWLREHRQEEREDAAQERNARQAMQRWDREHNRRPMPVKSQDPVKGTQGSQAKNSHHRTTKKTKQHKPGSKEKQQNFAAEKTSKQIAAR